MQGTGIGHYSEAELRIHDPRPGYDKAAAKLPQSCLLNGILPNTYYMYY